MREIVANILDFPKSSLDPKIWNPDNTLKPEVKKFIMDFIHSFAQANNFKATDQWITEIKAVGSLTTNLWNAKSDMDVHIGVDLPKFVEVEHPEMSEKEASDYLDEIRKQVDQVKAKVPGTEHPTEIYFETEFTTKASQQFSGTYSVLQDKWLVEPHIVGKDFDISTLHPDLLNLAKETASELDAAFGDIKRDVQDIKELSETISDWPAEQRELFEKKLQKRLDELEKEIKELVDLREDVAEKRKHYDAISEQEARFKYLQKFWYMHILTDLKTLLKQSPELSTKDIPIVENIMSQAELNKTAIPSRAAWIDPTGNFHVVKDTHADWLLGHHLKWFSKQGINPDKFYGQPNGLDKLMAEFIRRGWSRVGGDVSTGSFYGAEIKDIKNVPEAVFYFIAGEPSNYRFTIEDLNKNFVELTGEELAEGQKAVNKALQQKRMQQAALSKKEAAYADLPIEEQISQVIMVDVDDTISNENPDGSMGEPIKGAKEVLQKIQEQGYIIVLDSHRANTDEGREEIKNWMDKHEIPYDEFFMGDKPLAFRYIDDRAIQFTTWNDVLKQVEKAENHKAASLSQKYWIDLGGNEINIGNVAHGRWVLENDKLLKNKYDINLDHFWPKDASNLAGVLIDEFNWIRITSGYETSHNSDFAVELKSITNISPSLDNFIAKHYTGGGIEIDDSEGNFVIVDDPFPNIQSAVNKALRQPALAANLKPLSKKESVFNPYGDESLKQDPAYAVFEHIQPGYGPIPDMEMYTIFGDHPLFGSTVQKSKIEELGIPIREQEKKSAQVPSWASSAWISPTGEVFDLEKESHEDAIVGLINDPKVYIVEDPLTYAIKKGWTRFGEMGGGMESGLHVKDIRNIPSFVFDYVTKYSGQNREMVVADIKGQYVKMSVDEFVLGQKAVDKALQQKRMTTAQLGSEYDYSSAQFNLPKELSEKIIRWAVENIPEEQIVHDSKDPGTKGIQLESHITLKYGLLTNDFEEVKKVLDGEKSPHIKFGKTSFFASEGKDYDVVIIKVESEDLQQLNKKLCSQVEHEDTQGKEYHPHVTVAYVKQGSGKQWEGKDIITDEEIYLDILTFSPKEGEKRELELVKSTEKESSFMPSNTDLAPSDDWAGTVGYPTNESMDVPQDKSDEETWYSPENDRPRKQNWFWKLLNMFKKQQPMSKKETVQVKEASIGNVWVDPKGKIYELNGGEAHNEWISANLELLKKTYRLKVQQYHYNQAREYFDALDEGIENVDTPDIGDIWEQMINQGWVRIGDAGTAEVGVELKDLRNLPSFLDSILAQRLQDGMLVDIEQYSGKNSVTLKYPFKSAQQEVNRALQQRRIQNAALSRKDVIQVKEAVKDEDLLSFVINDPALNNYFNSRGIDVKQMFPKLKINYASESLPGNAYYSSDDNTIFINPDIPRRDIRETLIHEIEHVLQHKYDIIQDKSHEYTESPHPEQYTFPSEWGADLVWVRNLKNKGHSLDDIYKLERQKLERQYKTKDVSFNQDFIDRIKQLYELADVIEPQSIVSKQSKQWTTPKEPVNQPGMDWQWADYIYNYVEENWQDFLLGWLELDPKNYVKPIVLIEKIYADEGRVSAWVHIDFVNKAENPDAYIKLVISADIHYEPSYEPEGVETHEYLDNWETEILEYGVTDSLEKDSSYGPTNYKGPSVADHGYQNSAWDDMNVTYSPEEDEKFLDQNGADGYPNRWMGRHRGKYYTNEGKVVKMLEETSAALSKKDIKKKAIGPMSGWLAPDGKWFVVNNSHDTWIDNNLTLLKKIYKLPVGELKTPQMVEGGRWIGWLISHGWARVDGYLPSELDFEIADIKNPPKSIESLVWRYNPKVVILEDLQHNDIALDDFSEGLDSALRNPVANLKIKAAISGETVNHILNLIHQNGGATWNMSKGNLVGQPYFAVAVYPEKEQIVDEADFENLEGYLVNNESLLNNPNNSFGAWASGGKVYYDVVSTIADQNKAMELGKRNKQLAIFDLKNLVEISLQKMAKLAAAVSDKEQQKYYDDIYSDRWRDDSSPIDGGFEYNKGWSELNGNDFPAPKDLDKERALLDQLEKPIDRNMPTGLGEYAITYYDAFSDQGDQGGI